MILQKRNEKRTNKRVNKQGIGIDKAIQNGGQEVIKEYNIKKKKEKSLYKNKRRFLNRYSTD